MMKCKILATLTGTDRARYNLNNVTDVDRLAEYADTLPLPREVGSVPLYILENAIPLSDSVYAIERLDRIVLLTILED